MKKVIFTVTLIMMMAFSGLCFAADGNDLNRLCHNKWLILTRNSV